MPQLTLVNDQSRILGNTEIRFCLSASGPAAASAPSQT